MPHPVHALPVRVPLRGRGAGESTDLSWDGQTSIFENGRQLGQGARFEEEPQPTVADVDLDLLRQERARQGTFEDNRRVATPDARYRTVEFTSTRRTVT